MSLAYHLQKTGFSGLTTSLSLQIICIFASVSDNGPPMEQPSVCIVSVSAEKSTS